MARVMSVVISLEFERTRGSSDREMRFYGDEVDATQIAQYIYEAVQYEKDHDR